ncbi:MAG: KedN5 family methylcobalamin-dependent radical SAM C-methyltransferase [Micromonosporaceae bacterium]|nr:KedN5 family methylcobalamin-dependent radical SAM C-methyltransferase [Micromonosporaceae bacterium]
MPKESMPLAAGYLKANALQSDAIRDEIDIRIFNFGGGDTVTMMAETMFAGQPPDLLAMSVFGWSYHPFGAIAETYKQVRPDGWVVFGGTHVANQAERVFRQYPQVDVVVNGEGELVFRDLLLAFLAGSSTAELGDIGGISFRPEADRVVTTPAPKRIEDLDSIASPFLTGAMPLTDHKGEFRYDVALMETNRGCPYRCAFCYWGGAVGQKVRAFSQERLRAEIEVFAHHKVHTIVLCDANIGLLRQDLDFVEEVIRVRDKYGYPKSIEGSWAKNKSKVFYDIVRRMKQAGMRSSFTLALQTLGEPALDLMHRRNMKVNEWEDLVAWLREEGLDCYAELIWGAPGETVDSFFEGYDRLAQHMTRIAVYPLLLLPNTEYSEDKQRFGFQTVRGENDDFEYVLAHSTMTVAENLEMKRYILWARAVAEHLLLRHSWAPLRAYAGLTQSMVIREMIKWFEAAPDPGARRVARVADRVQRQPSLLPVFLRELYGEPALDELLARWWRESIVPQLPPQHVPLLDEVFRYDCLTRPVFDTPNGAAPDLPVVLVDGEPHYRRDRVVFEYDVPAVLEQVAQGTVAPAQPSRTELSLYYRVGFHKYYGNHEEGVYFVGWNDRDLSAR